MNDFPCGRKECVFSSIEEMIKKMKEEVARKQNIVFPEQIVVAEIYNINASTLAEACRRRFKIFSEKCIVKDRRINVNIDTFIFLKTIEEEGIISKEYKNELFESLLEMRPEIKEIVKKDKELGIL
ncbi:MAG: hypothetical protein QXX38_00255 [Candidatus Aenigmatarchaeota archaeon]